MSSSAKNDNKKKVKNPYLKASSSSSTKTHEQQTIGTTAAAKITPDERLDKLFAPKTKDVKRKPHDVRKLVPPSLDNSSDDENSASSSSLYYHSDDHTKKAKVDEQGHIHASLDYHHRGEMQLDQRKLKAYRFIRNNFLIPSDIEENAKFGPHSGQCFEERVIRAYTLDQLKPKKSHEKSTSSSSSSSLFVCSYCGDVGHKRDGCSKLL